MKHVSLFLALGLFVIAAFASTVTDQVQNAFYYGRSGDVVVHRRTHQPDSSVVILDPQQFVAVDKQMQSLTELQLAASVSDLLSLPHANADGQSVVNVNLFRKPGAVLLVDVEDLPSALVQRILTSVDGVSRLALTPDALPESALAAATTLSTGVPPAVHGVVGESWISTAGRSVDAFEAAHDAHVTVPTLAERMSEVHACGSSVVFGATSQSASVYASRGNHKGFSFTLNAERSSFDAVSGSVPRAVDTQSIAQLLATPEFVSRMGLRITADGKLAAANHVFVTADPLLAELAGLLVAADSAAASESCVLAVAVRISAFKELLAVQAEDSAAVTAALRVLSAAVASAQKALPRSVAVVVARGRPAAHDAEAVGITASVAETVPGAFASFPHVSAGSAAATLCSNLRSALRNTDYEVFCPSVDQSLQRKFAVLAAAPGYLINATNATGPDYVWQFNMFFWLTLTVIIVLAATVYGFSTAENKRDSLIYRTQRPDVTRSKTD